MTTQAASSQLHPPGTYSSWSAYLQRLWACREYMFHVPRHELRAQNMNTVLGNLWHLLNPILGIAIYYLVFGVLLEVTRGVENFIGFLAVGVFVFRYTQKSTMAGAKSLIQNEGLMRSISFPRAMVPITAVVTEAMAFVPGVFVFLAVALLTEEPVRLTWLALIPLFAAQFVFNVGLGLVAARANHAYRDVENLLPFLFRLLFYGSGVIFYVYAYLEHEGLRWLFILNPLFDFLALYRWAVLDMPLLWAETVAAAVWTVVLFLGGMVWFRRGESSYGG